MHSDFFFLMAGKQKAKNKKMSYSMSQSHFHFFLKNVDLAESHQDIMKIKNDSKRLIILFYKSGL